MVSEFGDSQYIEFKPRISPLRWTRPKPLGGLSVRSRARFYMMHVTRFMQNNVHTNQNNGYGNCGFCKKSLRDAPNTDPGDLERALRCACGTANARERPGTPGRGRSDSVGSATSVGSQNSTGVSNFERGRTAKRQDAYICHQLPALIERVSADRTELTRNSAAGWPSFG